MPSIHDVVSDISKGNYRMNTCGHKLNRTPEQLLEMVKGACQLFIETYTKYTGTNDGIAKILEAAAQDEFVEMGAHMPPLISLEETFCFDCGRGYHVFLKEPGVFALSTVQRERLAVSDGIWPYRLLAPIDTLCHYTEGTKPHKTVIEAPSGKLVFANHFGKQVADAPENQRYQAEYSLNGLRGRRNVADYLAGQGFGYGEAENTSIHLYRRRDNSEILVCEYELGHIEESIHELQAKEPGSREREQRLVPLRELFARLADYSYEGSIDCSVCRWMCADQKLLDSLGVQPPTHVESIAVSATAGNWVITNYLDSDEKNWPVVARLQLQL